jgi:Tfp pilus assembly protein PilO
MIGIVERLVVPCVTRPAIRSLTLSSACSLLALAALVGAYVEWVIPADDRLERAEAAYRKATLEQEQSRSQRALFEKALLTQEQVDTFWRALPSQDEYAALAMAISELGKAEHLTIPGMNYHVEKLEGQLPVKASLSFRVIGDYAAMYRFIHRLETAESYLVVESLDAARADKAARATSHAVVFNVTVATFLRPSPPRGNMS